MGGFLLYSHQRSTRQLCFVLFVLCFFAQTAIGEDTFKVGVLLCQTGNCADWGTAASRGARLAQDELNSGGGVLSRKIELITEDTAESISGAHAVTAYQSLVNKKLHYIIGPSWSPGVMSIAPIAAKSMDVLLITPSASARDFSRTADNIFNIRPVEEASTRGIARYAFQQGKRRFLAVNRQQKAHKEEFLKMSLSN